MNVSVHLSLAVVSEYISFTGGTPCPAVQLVAERGETGKRQRKLVMTTLKSIIFRLVTGQMKVSQKLAFYFFFKFLFSRGRFRTEMLNDIEPERACRSNMRSCHYLKRDI